MNPNITITDFYQNKEKVRRLNRKEEQNKINKVLFYTSIPRTFRTTLIGHLYEISQFFPVVLFSEELDLETKKILNDKKLFPKLEKIISVHQYTGKEKNLLSQNKYLYSLAKNTIKQYQPDIVITANDIFPFEMYLLRLAKRAKASTLCFLSGFFADVKQEDAARWYNLMTIHSVRPNFLPFSIKRLLLVIKRKIKKAIYYWALPFLMREKPLRGEASFIGVPKNGIRMRLEDVDHYVTFTERDYTSLAASGVPKKKLAILSHPLTRRKNQSFFKKIDYIPKTIVLFYPSEEVGIKKDTNQVISREEMFKSRIEIVRTIAETLKDWKIFIKLHPSVSNFEDMKKAFEPISERIKITNPGELAEKYMGISNVIVGLPVHGMEIYTTFLSYPEKPVIAINLSNELLGDDYKNFEGVEYIDSKEKLINLLELIRDNKYHKPHKEEKLSSKEFLDTVDLLEYLLSEDKSKLKFKSF